MAIVEVISVPVLLVRDLVLDKYLVYSTVPKCNRKHAQDLSPPWLCRRWRHAFEMPALPFIYVELCTEYGMPGFWDAQVRHAH